MLRGESKARHLSKVDKAIAFLYPYYGRAEQLEALRWLLFKKKDIILIAKTLFGKSMIMQAMPCLVWALVVIIILPLNAIGVEQKVKIEELPGTRWISTVSIIALRIFLSPKRVAISLFTLFFLAFFFCTLSVFTPSLLLVLSCSHTKERSPKDHRQSRKCSKITPTFSSFVTGRDIRSVDTPVGV